MAGPGVPDIVARSDSTHVGSSHECSGFCTMIGSAEAALFAPPNRQDPQRACLFEMFSVL